jgi:hypothetical protein
MPMKRISALIIFVALLLAGLYSCGELSSSDDVQPRVMEGDALDLSTFG